MTPQTLCPGRANSLIFSRDDLEIATVIFSCITIQMSASLCIKDTALYHQLTVCNSTLSYGFVGKRKLIIKSSELHSALV